MSDCGFDQYTKGFCLAGLEGATGNKIKCH